LAAVQVFPALGTNAHSAVPALLEIANQNISLKSRDSAVVALGFIGPPAEEAVPSLQESLREESTNALKAIDPEAAAKAGAK
jgi:hypothetical protein